MPLAAWHGAILDRFGNAQPGAPVEVRDETDNSLADIFADRDGVTPLSNPAFADSKGMLTFYAEGGAYKLTATFGSQSTVLRHVPVGLAQETDGGGGTDSGTNTGDQNVFSAIAVSGQPDVVADATSDTLTLAAGSGIAITTNASTATVTIAATGGGGGGGRELLSGDRTYYVRTDGSDSNDGLANTAGGAFLTIQKAVDTIATIDLNGKNVVVQVANGTYTTPVILKEVVGYSAPGCLIIRGSTGTPANVVLSTTNASAVAATAIGSVWRIEGMRLQTTTSGAGIWIISAGIQYGSVDFGACASAHVVAQSNARLAVIAPYSVSGGSQWHAFVQTSTIDGNFHTVTLTGTPAFSVEFIRTVGSAYVNWPGTTFSGAATGTRYLVSLNAVVNTNGGGASYFPGSVAGSTATGGHYI